MTRFVPKWEHKSNDPRFRPTYHSWKAMRNRCLHENHIYWDNYGGRGITICAEWIDNFDTFVRDMGLRPEGMTLERAKNDLGYFPGNCYWATKAEQSRNSRGVHFVEINGRKLALIDAARELGVHRDTLRARLRRGVPLDKRINAQH